MNTTNSTFDDLEVALRDPENIRSLRLGGLSWTEIPESLLSFRRLEELRLVGFPLNRLPEWLGELGNLRVLELSGACLGLVPDHLAGVASLQTVKLRHCGIEHFPEHLLRLGSLRELDLSSNRISSIPPLKWPSATSFTVSNTATSPRLIMLVITVPGISAYWSESTPIAFTPMSRDASNTPWPVVPDAW